MLIEDSETIFKIGHLLANFKHHARVSPGRCDHYSR